jgi:7,8-dihydroneopterin aldolase/epimerase/oxygenase
MTVRVELGGLEVFGHHGATEEEQRDGRILVYDLAWELPAEPPEDELDDTVDYEQVAAVVREVSDGRRFRLLESLAAAVADAVLERFPVASVSVRVRKRGIEPAGLALEYSAASVERSR